MKTKRELKQKSKFNWKSKQTIIAGAVILALVAICAIWCIIHNAKMQKEADKPTITIAMITEGRDAEKLAEYFDSSEFDDTKYNYAFLMLTPEERKHLQNMDDVIVLEAGDDTTTDIEQVIWAYENTPVRENNFVPDNIDVVRTMTEKKDGAPQEAPAIELITQD